SKFYMKMAKGRISGNDGAEAALQTIYRVMLTTLKMLSPITPFISEYLYRRFFMKHEKEDSLSLLMLEGEDDGDINALLEKQMEAVKEATSTALLARQTAGIKVRWPIRTLYIETKSHELIDAMNSCASILSKLLNAKEVKTVEVMPDGDIASQEFFGGTIHIQKKIDEELYEEGLLNEVKRRVLSMRKEMSLLEKDAVTLHIDTEDETRAILEKNSDKLREAVNATALEFKVDKEMKEFEIDGRLVKISLKKKTK
ncbi:TPA: hypothetical protein EYP38_02400, partial [Candidatus Micrarchaeota archaeon]|nr:hypothetical protein [Candidatus Micrarchaeota archaeon]